MLLTVLVAQLLAVPAAGEEVDLWDVSYTVRLVQPAQNSSQNLGPLAISGGITMSGGGSSTPLSLAGEVSTDQNLTGMAQVSMRNPPSYFRVDYIQTERPVYLVPLMTSQPYYLSDWKFTVEDSGFRFYPVTRRVASYSFFGTEADFSNIRGYVNQTSMQISIDLKLMMTGAKTVRLNLTTSERLISAITFDTPQAFHISGDSGLVIVPSSLDKLEFSGTYSLSLPSLPNPKRVDIPFWFRLDIASDPLDVGSGLVSTLRSTADMWLQDDENFFAKALVEDQEILTRIGEARAELSEASQLLSAGDLYAFSFPMANALELTARVRETRNDMTFFSVYLIAPVVVSFLLISAAMVGHLAFNGRPGYIAGIFAVVVLVSFASHPALRIFAMSIGPDLRNLPSIAITATLVGGVGYLIFKKAGAHTTYGLAISTAMRLIKARKLRGLLSLAAVCVVATSVVPTVTLRTTSPVLASTSDEATGLSLAWAAWSIRIRTASSDTTVEGLRPLDPGESQFLASVANLGDWTGVSAARVVLTSVDQPGNEIRGAVLIADLEKLAKVLGLGEDLFGPDFPAGILIATDAMGGQLGLTRSVTLNGMQVRVVGVFERDALPQTGGVNLADALLRVPVLTGGFSLTGASTTVIGGPLIGIVDAGEAAQVGISGIELGVVGKSGGVETGNLTERLMAVTLANRDWISFQDAELQIMLDVVLSYRFSVGHGSSVTNIQAALPLTLASGNWTSQLLLMLMGGLVVMNVMINSVVERKKEAITLSSLGASPSFVTDLFIAEGLTLGALGGAIGYAFGYAASAWLGVSSPAIKAELYTLTPLVLVLTLSLITTSLGSIFPARSAILQIVPSREILKREIGEIRFDPSGDALIMIPMRIRVWEWRTFSDFLRQTVNPPTTSYAYGLWILGYKKVDSVDTLAVEYKAFEGATAERKFAYSVEIRPTSMGEFAGVEMKVTGVPEWSDGHRLLLKDVVYDMKNQLIKYTTYDKAAKKLAPEEEMEEIEAHIARMKGEREDLGKRLRELDWSIEELEDRLRKLRDGLEGTNPA